MNRLLAVVVVVIAVSLTGIAFAQEAGHPDLLDAKPMYKTLPNHRELAPQTPAATITQWNGSYTDLTKKTINFTQIGTDPNTTNTTTTIPVYIIPVKMVYSKNNGNATFDPSKQVLSNGKTVINNILRVAAVHLRGRLHAGWDGSWDYAVH